MTDNKTSNQSGAPIEVHTMPDKFISSGSPSSVPVPPSSMPGMAPEAPRKSGKVNWIIIVVIIIAVLAIAGGVGFLIVTNLPSQETQQIVDEGQTNQENKNFNLNKNSNSNSNSNSNINSNANDNANSNLNVNENENSNSNVNSNNANGNGNTNTIVNTKPEVEMATDSDIDGLTTEEEKLYGTKVDKPDTDVDGYKDGIEIANGFNPNGDGDLVDTDLADIYTNSEYGYTIVYPTNWIAEAISEDDNQNIMFTPSEMSTAGEFMEIIVEKNPYGFAALDWYLDQNKDLIVSQVDTIEIHGLEGIISVDGYTVYFADSDYIYAFTYNFGSKTEINYSSTFKMMYSSFRMDDDLKVDTNVNNNANSNSNSNSNKNNNDNSSTD